MPGVTYYTGVDDQQLAALYRRAWLCASPSTYEGFGLPYIEAMACGTPVVATPNPGSREVLADGEYGRLPADDEFGRDRLELLRDERARRQLEGAGVTRARQFSLSTMLDRYEALVRTPAWSTCGIDRQSLARLFSPSCSSRRCMSRPSKT